MCLWEGGAKLSAEVVNKNAVYVCVRAKLSAEVVIKNAVYVCVGAKLSTEVVIRIAVSLDAFPKTLRAARRVLEVDSLCWETLSCP